MPASPPSILPLSPRVTLGQLLRAAGSGGIFGVWTDSGPAGRHPCILRIQGPLSVTLLLGRDLGALIDRVAVVLARRRGRVEAIASERLREGRWLELVSAAQPALFRPLTRTTPEGELTTFASRGVAADSSRVRYLG